MDAAIADFQAQCVAPLAADACPVMAADAAGLARIAPPPGSGAGVMAWRTPGGGTLLIDAYATGVCRVILPAEVNVNVDAIRTDGARVRVERDGPKRVLVAEAGN